MTDPAPLPLIPAPQSLSSRTGPSGPLTSAHVAALAAALDTWAPRAAAAARRTLSPFVDAGASPIEVTVRATLDESLAAEGSTISPPTTPDWISAST